MVSTYSEKSASIELMTTATTPAPAELAVDPGLRTDTRRLSRNRLAGLLGTCVAVAPWVLWRTGPGKVPYLGMFESTARQWPTAPLPADSQYILREPLGQILYRVLPVHGVGVYLALHLVCLLGSAARDVAVPTAGPGQRVGGLHGSGVGPGDGGAAAVDWDV